jgi:hypothetical protein
MNKNLWLLTLCQGLFLTNNVTFIAINGLVGLSLAPLGWMATLPVMGYVVGGALSTGLVARTQQRYGRKNSFQLGLLVALSSSGKGNRVMTSPDGISWSSRSSAADNAWTSLCWSPQRELLVAAASSGTGNRIMTSADGLSWTVRSSPADLGWRSLCWSPQRRQFAAVSNSGAGNRVMVSP